MNFISNTSKWCGVLSFFLLCGFSNNNNKTTQHPYYISVTEVNYNNNEKQIEVACKIFTDDFENALEASCRCKVDLHSTIDTAINNKQIAAYIIAHLHIKADNSTTTLHFEGYQVEGEAAWCYFSAPAAQQPKNIEIFNDLLYQFKREQVNIMHVKIGSNRKSERLAFPENIAKFDF